MKVLGLFIIMSMSVSCATVRVVKKRPGRGGTIAVKQGFIGESADVKAARIMSSNCRRGYRILSEGEHAVGKVSSTSSRGRTKHGIDYGNSQTVETQTNEWRVKYKCKRKSRRG